jgi:hypothetical protein
MTRKPQTSQQYFNSIGLIFWALLFVQLITASVIYYVNQSTSVVVDFEYENILIFIIPVVMLVGIISGQIFARKIVEKNKQKELLEDKLNAVRSAIIIRLASIEGPSLFAIIGYFISNNTIFLAMAGVGMVYFYLQKPTREIIINDVELNTKEIERLSKPDEVVANIER